MILEVPGVEVASKKPSKNDKKMKSRWEGILASIFGRFWWVLEAKLGRKTKPRQAKTREDKGREGKEREGKGKGRERQGLEGKSVAAVILRPGGGVHPTLRGRPP